MQILLQAKSRFSRKKNGDSQEQNTFSKTKTFSRKFSSQEKFIFKIDFQKQSSFSRKK